MAFYIKDKNGNYRQSNGACGFKVFPFAVAAEEFNTSTAAQTALNQFSRMSLAATGATVVEE